MGEIPSLKLTARAWKWMVGRWNSWWSGYWRSSCDYCWWSDSVMFQPMRISTGSEILYPWKWKMGESPILLDLSWRVIFHWTNDYGRKGNTARKNNNWTCNGGLVQMIFLFHWLTFGFQLLIFRGVMVGFQTFSLCFWGGFVYLEKSKPICS